MGEISLSKLLVVAVIFTLLFGTKKLRSMGEDFGTAIRGFKKAMSDDEPQKKDIDPQQQVKHEK
ncbi:twin-arginine translocase TatA/TatE family subunit [Vibrio profundum]|uniref:twin-arginine translocase TatA/TatE family subunit n=1 Tax=Vibrio profundum TaxID=2910247 RepID=UPI003D11177D